MEMLWEDLEEGDWIELTDEARELAVIFPCWKNNYWFNNKLEVLMVNRVGDLYYNIYFIVPNSVVINHFQIDKNGMYNNILFLKIIKLKDE